MCVVVCECVRELLLVSAQTSLVREKGGGGRSFLVIITLSAAKFHILPPLQEKELHHDLKKVLYFKHLAA